MIFSPNSFWNVPLPDDAPIDADSSAIVSTVATSANSLSTFRRVDDSTGYFLAGPGISTVSFTFDRAPGVLSAGFIAAFNAVPMPTAARPVPPWPSGDNHMVVYQPSTDKYWETWKTRKFEVDGAATATGQAVGAINLSAPGWHAQYGGAMINASASPGYFQTTSWPGDPIARGATATKLPVIGGVIMRDEGIAARDGDPDAIPHCLAFNMVNNLTRNTFRWPALASDGSSSNATHPQSGSLFRLPFDYDLSGITQPFVLAVATAMKNYGFVLRDTSNAPQFFCECTATVPNSQTTVADDWTPGGDPGKIFPASPAVTAAMLPWSDIELVDAAYRPVAPAVPDPVPTRTKLIIGTA